MTVEDRVTFNEPDDWVGPEYAVGLVDEIVLADCVAHFEMCGDDSAYLLLRTREGREVFANIYARPTTREEKQQILTSGGDWSNAARRAANAVLCVDIDYDTGEES